MLAETSLFVTHFLVRFLLVLLVDSLIQLFYYYIEAMSFFIILSVQQQGSIGNQTMKNAVYNELLKIHLVVKENIRIPFIICTQSCKLWMGKLITWTICFLFFYYRDTPTSAGPNSFNKGKHGFSDNQKLWERNMKSHLGNVREQDE